MSWEVKGKATQIYIEIDYTPIKTFTTDATIRDFTVDIFPCFMGIIFSHYILPQLILVDEEKEGNAPIDFTTGLGAIWNRRIE